MDYFSLIELNDEIKRHAERRSFTNCSPYTLQHLVVKDLKTLPVQKLERCKKMNNFVDQEEKPQVKSKDWDVGVPVCIVMETCSEKTWDIVICCLSWYDGNQLTNLLISQGSSSASLKSCLGGLPVAIQTAHSILVLTRWSFRAAEVGPRHLPISDSAEVNPHMKIQTAKYVLHKSPGT